MDYNFSKNLDGLPTIKDILRLNEIRSRRYKTKFNKKDLALISNAVMLLVLAEDHRKTYLNNINNFNIISNYFIIFLD